MASYTHVVVTGAAGAIGAALARELLAAWPSVHVALVDRDAVGLDEVARGLEAPSRTATYTADLRDLESLADLLATIERRAPIDGLINCAGVMDVRSLASWDWADAQALLDIDLMAPLQLQQRIVPQLIEKQHGLIVNIASMAGRVPLKGGAYYCAAKAGLAMASEIARAELAEHGIRVVTVYPGPVKSALEQGARDAYGGGGMFARVAPTGDARELARRIRHAVDHDEPRVIYPRVYGMGWTAPNLSSWITLSYGPPPVR
jgi:short-subunit dehydrogenase